MEQSRDREEAEGSLVHPALRSLTVAAPCNMTRRGLLGLPLLAAVRGELLEIPVRHVMDSRAKFNPEIIGAFRGKIWPEAVRDFARAGIQLTASEVKGEIKQAPSGWSDITGLDYGVVNFVLTDEIPMHWDRGRGLTAVTTLYRNYHVCMIALNRAHGHQAPMLSVNTCVHELLHALLHDIFENRPQGFSGSMREARIDWYATRLWLFHGGGDLRKLAEEYLRRLRSRPAGPGGPSYLL